MIENEKKIGRTQFQQYRKAGKRVTPILVSKILGLRLGLPEVSWFYFPTNSAVAMFKVLTSVYKSAVFLIKNRNAT